MIVTKRESMASLNPNTSPYYDCCKLCRNIGLVSWIRDAILSCFFLSRVIDADMRQRRLIVNSPVAELQ